ncbi:hypothetical protein QE152_g37628 [Popillia japonica]|uniref:Uncharacterized protein n=1 Tax=Popillia japonica TaxID=7064 RepID=A0AAW1IAA1_POPJA
MLEGCASLTLLADGLIDITRKTDEEPSTSAGDKSWRDWWRTLAALPNKKLKEKNQMSYQTLPIYEDLPKDELLQRRLNGFTENNNESYNQLTWKLAPNHFPCIFDKRQT